jgi:putative heme iron utilization protein
MNSPSPEPPAADLGFTLRCLARAARAGSLATTRGAGEPFVSLVTPAFSADFAALLLLSGLSEHTRHLRADPRCALLLTGAAPMPNPQTTPRLTLLGLAEPVTDAALTARYLAIHPYAKLYAGFGDFGLWRLIPREAHYVGGFGLARRVAAARLSPDPDATAAIATCAPALITGSAAGAGGEIVVLDTDGCDVAAGETTRRLAFPAPAASAEEVRHALTRLAPAPPTE